MLLALLACRHEAPGPKPGDSAADTHTGGDSATSGDCESSEWFADGDEDGWGTGLPVDACTQPEGYSPESGDCDDESSSVYPGAPETCDDVDDDCDGLVDGQDPDVTGATTWYADVDEDGLGDPSSPLSACGHPPGHVDNAEDCDDLDATNPCDATCGASFYCLDLTDDVNRDHTNGPWTDDASESFDVAPGVHGWTIADGSAVDFVIIDPEQNQGASLALTRGGESWRPSYSFPERFTIDGEGAAGARLHIAGLASGWSDPNLFTGVAATLTVSFSDGTRQTVELANGTNLDDWNHTWHEVSDEDAVRVYEDTTYGRHIDAWSFTLASAAPIDTIEILDDATVHTGSAEKTSVAIFALTIGP